LILKNSKDSAFVRVNEKAWLIKRFFYGEHHELMNKNNGLSTKPEVSNQILNKLTTKYISAEVKNLKLT
jgi:hypothetical protein